MSTNKTENYQLHSWVPSDDFRLHEINENFAKLDQAASGKVGMIVGQYMGACRVELGVRPLAVIVIGITGGSENYSYHAIAAQDLPFDAALVLDESGFTTANDTNRWVRLGIASIRYNYVVFY